MSNNTIFKKACFITLSILWMFVIYTFSSKTASDSTEDSMFITEIIARMFFSAPSEHILSVIEVIIRKMAHLTEFAILSFLYCLTISSFSKLKKHTLLAVLFTFIYAGCDEIHQYFVPGRACMFVDVLIDTFGGFLGYLFFWFCQSVSKMKK